MNSLADTVSKRFEPVPPSLPLKPLLWLVWFVSVLVGGYGVYLRLTQGHLPAGYGSYVPWGLWIALYFHGVGMAGGVFVISALGYLLRWRGFAHERSLRLAIVLSVASIIPAFLGVFLDLGRMDRAVRIAAHPNFTSMMAFNAWMYGLYMCVAAVIFFLSYRPQTPWLRPLLCVGMLLSTMFPSQSGAFFGVVDARSYWHNPLLPVLFFTSAVTAGSALLLVVRYIVGGTSCAQNVAALRSLRNITIGGLVLYLFFEFAEISISLWNPMSHAPAVELVLFGSYWWVFWLIHLLAGGVVAFVLLVRRHQILSWAVGALLVAVTFVSARLNVLIPGQVVSELHGLQEAFYHPRLQYLYHPTAMEYYVGLFMVAVGLTIFFVGWRISQLLEATSQPSQSNTR
ncbi:MAG: polysulfide reductase [Candidatus Sumerlaea sp.]|jgi:molybdopterin-containing oxidoreductase family membrane subunit|uniref:Molybdopterin oxidoreductase membrane subunit n=1 Tax=Sumerlaea chitinivorans TaxID=2250252 RepID=A0A2Z4Y7E3_SUMC1|nr:Molybdopterin oxidoreductase membrane subunit [Candidatus Sumerlaea chitinivorans]GIX43966.1 MAG: polysulfide reductase [Candidatus Sumerlaea sp.]